MCLLSLVCSAACWARVYSIGCRCISTLPSSLGYAVSRVMCPRLPPPIGRPPCLCVLRPWLSKGDRVSGWSSRQSAGRGARRRAAVRSSTSPLSVRRRRASSSGCSPGRSLPYRRPLDGDPTDICATIHGGGTYLPRPAGLSRSGAYVCRHIWGKDPAAVDCVPLLDGVGTDTGGGWVDAGLQRCINAGPCV